MNVAIIPARGGSKRIPNKNINNFNGKPIISWSIKCAFKTKLFDRIIVSTDNQEIAKTAKQYGAEVPFIRPKNLSNDSVGIIEVISHATRWMLKNGIEPKYYYNFVGKSVKIKLNKYDRLEWDHIDK